MKITVDTLGGQFSFECAPTEHILYAALSHGLSVPYECATGTCGTCRGRVHAGGVDVEWDEAPGFARLKRDKGDVLMCQARPTADCVLRIPANVAGAPNPNLTGAFSLDGTREMTAERAESSARKVTPTPDYPPCSRRSHPAPSCPI